MDWTATLPPAVVMFGAGTYFAYKYLRNGKKCPATGVLDVVNDKNIAQTEAFKAVCLSLDRNADAVKEMAEAQRRSSDVHAEQITKLAQAFIEGAKNGRR